MACRKFSLLQGYASSVELRGTDGSGQVAIFSDDIMEGGSQDALRHKSDGKRALDETTSLWSLPQVKFNCPWNREKGSNTRTLKHYMSIVVQGKVWYVLEGDNPPDVLSKNNCFETVFY
jgi:hypothetical protein